MDDLRVERILRAVECVPPGRAATYGLIGRVVGESPRVVGHVMARWGSTVPWWRIVNAQGLIPGHESVVHDHWAREGLLAPDAARPASSGRGGAARVRLSQVLADEDRLRRDWTLAIGDLGDPAPEASS